MKNQKPLARLERALLLNLAFFSPNSDGWKSREDIDDRNEIITKNQVKGLISIFPERYILIGDEFDLRFTSGLSSLSSYAEKLEKKDLIETLPRDYSDERGRPHKRKEYRIRKTLKAALILYGFLGELDRLKIESNLGTQNIFSYQKLFYESDYYHSLSQKLKEKIIEKQNRDLQKNQELLKKEIVEKYLKHYQGVLYYRTLLPSFGINTAKFEAEVEEMIRTNKILN